ncbi:hypothetical protein [Rickettsia sp. Tenjiku01]|uniref:hypothetical protein n=1 Tax=Rickettsia sp. Tenjiku01 TaxID=1736693 RepID=UPI000AC49C03|nr:hypothetical protein [Rickettsia sp. Tenjiku01]
MVEQYSLYSTYKLGVSWVDALNGSVRPVLAYSFFAMYGGVTYVQYKSLKSSALLVEISRYIMEHRRSNYFCGDY